MNATREIDTVKSPTALNNHKSSCLFCSPVLNLLKNFETNIQFRETFLCHEKYVPRYQKIHPIKVIVKFLHRNCSCPLCWLKKITDHEIVDWVTAQGSKVLQNYEENSILHVSIAVKEIASSAFAFRPLLNRKLFTHHWSPNRRKRKRKRKREILTLSAWCDREPVGMKKV